MCISRSLPNKCAEYWKASEKSKEAEVILSHVGRSCVLTPELQDRAKWFGRCDNMITELGLHCRGAGGTRGQNLTEKP